MYLSFYRLNEKPFQINTEPRFLWTGEIHKEALSVLKYGVMSRNGILTLTGNVGTGKTILVNALLADLDDGIIIEIFNRPAIREIFRSSEGWTSYRRRDTQRKSLNSVTQKAKTGIRSGLAATIP